jgi:hypothetical protein
MADLLHARLCARKDTAVTVGKDEGNISLPEVRDVGPGLGKDGRFRRLGLLSKRRADVERQGE